VSRAASLLSITSRKKMEEMRQRPQRLPASARTEFKAVLPRSLRAKTTLPSPLARSVFNNLFQVDCSNEEFQTIKATKIAETFDELAEEDKMLIEWKEVSTYFLSRY